MVTHRSIAASIALALAGCDDARTPPTGTPEVTSPAPIPEAPAARPSPPQLGPAAAPSAATTPSAAATPEPPTAPEPPAAPRWTLTCVAKGGAPTLTASLRPGGDVHGVLALTLADGAGRSRTWSKPEALVLLGALDEHVLGIHRPPASGPDAEHLELHALPKTFVLGDRSAKFSARSTLARLDDEAASSTLELSCEAQQERAP